MQGFVVDGFIEVLDEDVADTGLAVGGVAMGPHDAHGATGKGGVVELLQGTLCGRGVEGRVEVDIGVAERATSDGITADANGSDRANLLLLMLLLVLLWGRERERDVSEMSQRQGRWVGGKWRQIRREYIAAEHHEHG